MREIIHQGAVYVKRVSTSWLPFKNNDELAKWQERPVAVFHEGGEDWLVIFSDYLTSIGFFTQNSAPTATQVRAPDVFQTMKSRATTQLFRGIAELIPVKEISSITQSCTNTKGIPDSVGNTLHLIELQCSGGANDKAQKIKLASEVQPVIAKWSQILEERRHSLMAPASADSKPQRIAKAKPQVEEEEEWDNEENDLYCTFNPTIFAVKLTRFPETCPAELQLRNNSIYRFRIDDDALTLLTHSEPQKTVTRWQLAFIRNFRRPTEASCNELCFKAGRRCDSTEGIVCFETKEAPFIYELIQKQLARCRDEQFESARDSGSSVSSAPNELPPSPFVNVPKSGSDEREEPEDAYEQPIEVSRPPVLPAAESRKMVSVAREAALMAASLRSAAANENVQQNSLSSREENVPQATAVMPSKPPKSSPRPAVIPRPMPRSAVLARKISDACSNDPLPSSDASKDKELGSEPVQSESHPRTSEATSSADSVKEMAKRLGTALTFPKALPPVTNPNPLPIPLSTESTSDEHIYMNFPAPSPAAPAPAPAPAPLPPRRPTRTNPPV